MLILSEMAEAVTEPMRFCVRFLRDHDIELSRNYDFAALCLSRG
jgi:hypothetical protein